MMARLLMGASAAIILALGLIHLLYTFSGTKLTPRSAQLLSSMMEISPVLTKETTMWKAWVGFNASHSAGAILFGLIYLYFAVAESALLFRSPYLLLVGIAMLAGFVVLGKLYWFSIPFISVCIAAACYLASVIMSRI